MIKTDFLVNANTGKNLTFPFNYPEDYDEYQEIEVGWEQCAKQCIARYFFHNLSLTVTIVTYCTIHRMLLYVLTGIKRRESVVHGPLTTSKEYVTFTVLMPAVDRYKNRP